MITRIEKGLVNDLKEKDGLVLMIHRDDLPYMWGSMQDLFRVDLNWFTEEGITFIDENTETPAVKKKIAQFRKFKANPDEKVKTLKNIPTIVKARYENEKYKWLFEQTADGTLLAWYIQDSQYSPPQPRYQYPASADLELRAIGLLGVRQKTITWHGEDIQGKSFSDLLGDAGLMEWDEELMTQYTEADKDWKKTLNQTGAQMLAYGNGTMFYETKRSWDNELRMDDKQISCTVDGKPVKFVVDCDTEEIEKSKDKQILKKFWSTAADEEEIEDPIPVPRHPEILGFSLHHHNYVLVYMTNLKPYPWNDKIEDSLVLPKDDKRLIRILIESTGKKMSDIVSGKSGGVIVMTSGDPGTGKTLTAEATSELLHKALYNVQCSQLGLDVKEIERNLYRILSRATRWGALLLLDEADVYVRSRGKDIMQNAIVGIFLRLLEYYNGFLFMTTNRATTVDDAILSRCTAHVRYLLPNTNSIKKITGIQEELLEIEMTDDAKEYIVSGLNNISGRDIRSILKMAKLVSEAEGQVVDAALLKFCVKYQDINSEG